jgi:hypothetical protein
MFLLATNGAKLGRTVTDKAREGKHGFGQRTIDQLKNIIHWQPERVKRNPSDDRAWDQPELNKITRRIPPLTRNASGRQSRRRTLRFGDLLKNLIFSSWCHVEEFQNTSLFGDRELGALRQKL